MANLILTLRSNHPAYAYVHKYSALFISDVRFGERKQTKQKQTYKNVFLKKGKWNY